MKCRQIRLFTNRGSVMVQVLILAGLVTLVGATVMQMYLMNKKEAESEIQNADMSLLQTLINSILRNELSCRKALGGSTSYANVEAEVLGPAPQSFNTSTGSEIKIYQIDGVTPFLSSTDSSANTFGRLKIDSIFLEPLYAVPGSAGKIYFSKLIIKATKAGGVAGAAQVLRQDAKVSVRLKLGSPNYILSCSAVSFLADDNVTQLPLPVCLSDQMLFSNGNAITCVQAVCPVGTSVKTPPCTSPDTDKAGKCYKPDGSIRCI